MTSRLLLLLAVGLSGCSSLGLSQAPPSQESLAMACQVARCECRSPRSTFSLSGDKTEPVQWHSDGTAYCPEGYQLSRVE
jgi:hypothetical protein